MDGSVFLDRDLNDIDGAELERLFKTPGYVNIASERFPELGVILRVRWIGHDRERNTPPQIFLVQSLGIRGLPESTYATEPGALAAFDVLAQRYREQVRQLADGMPVSLVEGIL